MMMTHDPLQTQLSMGAYSGAINPFGSPYALNPFAGVAQQNYPGVQQGYGGVPNYGAIAQQQQHLQQQLQQLQQLASILAAQAAIPQPGIAQTNPWQAQPNVFQNPSLGQNPQVNPILAQQLA